MGIERGMLKLMIRDLFFLFPFLTMEVGEQECGSDATEIAGRREARVLIVATQTY
jgi:hypothetical protein